MTGQSASKQQPQVTKPANTSFTQGSLVGHVFRLSGFMIMGFLAMTIAQLIEAVYLGMVGRDELAALAFTFPLIMAFNAVTRGIGIGTGAVLARAMGAGNREQAALLASHGLLLTFGFTLLCALGLVFAAPGLFGLMGASGRILELAVAYQQIWCIGFPLFGLSMIGSGLMRSIGDPAFPGYVMTTGSLLQVVVAPPLIFGWGPLDAMGIEGAAWAFVIARSLSFAMTGWWFVAREDMIRWQLAGVLQSSRDIVHVAIPAGASNLIAPVSTAIITALLAGFGTAVVAGFGVAARIEAVVGMVVIGIAASAAPLVGQNWGARLYSRVVQALRLTYRFCLIWGLIAGVLMWLCGATIAGLISDDAEVVSTATSYLYWIPVTLGFVGVTNVANASFNALSKPVPPLALSLLRLLLVYVPLAWLAARYLGYQAVFVVTALVNVAFGIAAWWWHRRVLRGLLADAQAA